MVPRPSVRLDRLKQLNPQAGVAFGRALVVAAAATLAAERPITDVTATPAASTEHALAKRLRIGEFLPVLEFARPTAITRRLGRSSRKPVTAGDDTATMLAKVT